MGKRNAIIQKTGKENYRWILVISSPRFTIMVHKELTEEATLDVENIGGIDWASVQLEPGVTILTGRNATNRSSFLQAIMAVTGSDNATLKADAEQGDIKLDLGEHTYSRELVHRDGSVMMEGQPYLDDPTLADLFAFLLESNECREAIARGDDLREIIMRPIDTGEIEREISQLRGRRKAIGAQLEELDGLSKRLPQLEEKKSRLQGEIDNKKIQLADKEEELEDIGKSVDQSRAENEEIDTKMSQLQQARNDLKTTRRNIDSEKESIDALQDELAEQRAAYDELSSVPEDRISNLDQEMQRMRGQIDALDQTINELQSLIQFNDEFLEDGQREIVEQLHPNTETSDGSVTSQLLGEGETVTCWTCGADVSTQQIESNLESLRSFRQQKMQDRRSLKQDIEEFQSEKSELQEQRQRFQKLNATIEHTENEITDRKESLESFKSQKEDLSSEVTELEKEIEELQKEDFSEVLDVQEDVNHIEFQIDNLATKVSNIEDEIESTKNRLDEREDLEAQRAEIQDEIANLQTRVEQLQKQAIEEFNNHMDAVLQLLDYDNLERIWIERTQERVRQGRSKVEKERFDLHVVRSTDSGTVFEDTVDHLSESEREVTGLVFALAGYLVHEVYQTVPFMLLDSIEAIDAERIASLVDYLEGYADYLIVALLEEDATMLDDSYERVTSI